MGGVSSRERLVIRAGILLAGILALLKFLVLPVYDRGRDLERVLTAERQSLSRIRELRKEYLQISPALSEDALAGIAVEKGFSLFSFLDRAATKTGIKGNIDSMKPHLQDIEKSSFAVSIVKLTVNQAGYGDLVSFLTEVEEARQGLRITSLTLVRTGKADKVLNATMEVQTLVPKESG